MPTRDKSYELEESKIILKQKMWYGDRKQIEEYV